MGSTAVMNLMLGWLKSVASWVLGLFDLAGNSGFSPLTWLADNWLSILIVLLIAGVAFDLLVWLLRWRPHWIWFNKKRIVINDDDFFAGEDLVDAGLYDPTLFTDAAPVRRRSTPPPRRVHPADARQRTRSTPARRAPGRREAEYSDEIFTVSRATDSVGGEDEVFNVSDLPVSRDELAFRDSQKRR